MQIVIVNQLTHVLNGKVKLMSRYIVEEVPPKWFTTPTPEKVYYCHEKGYDYIPVFGSIGSKEKANKVCKMMNGR